MKTTITISVGMLIVGVMSVLVTQRDSIEEFFANTAEVQVEKEEIIVEVSPEWATDTEAVEAAQAVIHRKQLEAELSALEASFEATTATYEGEKSAYKDNKERIEKELGTY